MKKYCMALLLAACVVGTACASEEALIEAEDIGETMQEIIGKHLCDFQARYFSRIRKAIESGEGKFKQRCDKLGQKWDHFIAEKGPSLESELVIALMAENDLSKEEAVETSQIVVQGLKNMHSTSLRQRRIVYKRYVALYKGQGSYSDSDSDEN